MGERPSFPNSFKDPINAFGPESASLSSCQATSRMKLMGKSCLGIGILQLRKVVQQRTPNTKKTFPSELEYFYLIEGDDTMFSPNSERSSPQQPASIAT